MDLYFDQNKAKKFYPLLILRDINDDISKKHNDISLYVNVGILCKNDFWNKIFYPEDTGFMIDTDYTYLYNSSIDSLDILIKCLDIIHGKSIITNLLEDIHISRLLFNLAPEQTYKEFITVKKISQNIDKTTIDIDEQFILDYVHKDRWRELNIFSKTNDYIIDYEVDGIQGTTTVRLDYKWVLNYLNLEEFNKVGFKLNKQSEKIDYYLDNLQSFVKLFSESKYYTFGIKNINEFLKKYVNSEGISFLLLSGFKW